MRPARAPILPDGWSAPSTSVPATRAEALNRSAPQRCRRLVASTLTPSPSPGGRGEKRNWRGRGEKGIDGIARHVSRRGAVPSSKFNLELLAERFGPFEKRRKRGVEHLSVFQPRQGRRVDTHPLRHFSESQVLVFPNGFESGHQIDNRREAPLVDRAGRLPTGRIGRVLTAERLLLRNLFRGSFWFRRWFYAFTPLTRGLLRQ